MNSIINFYKKNKVRIIASTIVCNILFVIFFWWYWHYLIAGLPSLEELENPKPELATKIYSIDGEILDQFFIKNRTYIQLQQIPPTLVQGLVATEDKNFYEHWGLDVTRIFKAMVKNILALRAKE